MKGGFNTPAIWHCFTPFLESHSASTSAIPCGGKAVGKGNSVLYRDMVVICYNIRQILDYITIIMHLPDPKEFGP